MRFDRRLIADSKGRWYPNLIRDYLADEPGIAPWYLYRPSIEGIKQRYQQGQASCFNRKALVAALQQQYAAWPDQQATKAALEDLADPEAVTITTAHQPILFGGPLYVLYKIASAVSLSRKVSSETGKKVIPVFWIGDDDHDFDEINHCQVDGHRFGWERAAGGAVGELSTEGIEEVIFALERMLGTRQGAEDMVSKLRGYYAADDFKEATGRLIHDWFGHLGVLIVYSSDPALKRLFAPIMRQELLNQPTQDLVLERSKMMADQYSAQAHPRPINLFYHTKGGRHRIVQDTHGFRLAESKLVINPVQELETNPERFSPNVILRPLFQEAVLPNVCFVGGPGELSYWLQLSGVFEHFDLPFPVLIPRDSFAILDGRHASKWLRTNLVDDLLMEGLPQIQQAWIDQHILAKTAQEVADIRMSIEQQLTRLGETLAQHDLTLEQAAAAASTDVLSRLRALDAKTVRTLKRRNEQVMTDIQKVHNYLFPGGVPQERRESAIRYLMQGQEAFIQAILNASNPLEFGLKLLVER